MRFVKVDSWCPYETYVEETVYLNIDSIILFCEHDRSPSYTLIKLFDLSVVVKCPADNLLTFLESEYTKQNSKLGELL